MLTPLVPSPSQLGHGKPNKHISSGQSATPHPSIRKPPSGLCLAGRGHGGGNRRGSSTEAFGFVSLSPLGWSCNCICSARLSPRLCTCGWFDRLLARPMLWQTGAAFMDAGVQFSKRKAGCKLSPILYSRRMTLASTLMIRLPYTSIVHSKGHVATQAAPLLLSCSGSNPGAVSA